MQFEMPVGLITSRAASWPVASQSIGFRARGNPQGRNKGTVTLSAYA
jgi:hypothetical protein